MLGWTAEEPRGPQPGDGLRWGYFPNAADTEESPMLPRELGQRGVSGNIFQYVQDRSHAQAHAHGRHTEERLSCPLPVAWERLQGSPNTPHPLPRSMPTPRTSIRTDPLHWLGLPANSPWCPPPPCGHSHGRWLWAGWCPPRAVHSRGHQSPCPWQQTPSFHGGTARWPRETRGRKEARPALGSACSLWAHARDL